MPNNDHKNLPSPKLSATPEENSATASNTAPDKVMALKPEWLPEKFWDADKGEIRVRALAKSYSSLEKRLSSAGAGAAHKKPPLSISGEKPMSEFADKPMDKPMDKLVDKSMDKPSDDIGQAFADEAPENAMTAEVSIALESRDAAVEEVLAQAFGGMEKWRKLQPRLVSWGRRNLPTGTYESFADSLDGIKMLHRLMQSVPSEPQLIEGGAIPAALDESRLRRMMQDPRYWRDREPEFVNRVLHGFRQLYGN